VNLFSFHKGKIPLTEVSGWFRYFLLEVKQEAPSKSHQRQLVDGSDPIYLCGMQKPLERSVVSPSRKDLNNPPTAVGGIFESRVSLVVERI